MANTKTVKKDNKETQKKTINIARSSDYNIIYSDTARISISAYDIKVTFSLNETLPDGNTLITELVTVALSPLHAKVLADILSRNVVKYEEQVMPLNVIEGAIVSQDEELKNLEFLT